MGSELYLEVTEPESTYRNKHYHDLRAVKQRELSCTSCGNVLSHESEHVFSHPIFGILQCRKCYDRVKDTLDSDDESISCYLCTIPRKNSYKCDRKNCSYTFCQACIKRNAPQSLVEAESTKWKCFACNSKPLWKLRGACAAVMSSISKRTKRKKVSRNRSSDSEDAKSDLRNISYVRRRQLTKAKKLRKRLKSVCDEESPTQVSQPVRYDIDKYQRGLNLDSFGGTTKFDEKFGRASSSHLSIDTSSDDSDIQEIKCISPRKIVKTKLRRENSPETRKIRRTDTRNERVEASRGRRNAREAGPGVSMSTQNFSSSSSDSSSDDSDMEDLKRSMPSIFAKQKSKVKNKSIENKRSVVANEASDDEKTVTRKRSLKSSTIEATSGRAKSVKSTRGGKKTPKSLEVVAELDSDSKSPRETRKTSKNIGANATSRRNGGVKKSTRKSRRYESPENSEETDEKLEKSTSKSARDDTLGKSRRNDKSRKSRRDESSESNEDSDKTSIKSTSKSTRDERSRKSRRDESPESNEDSDERSIKSTSKSRRDERLRKSRRDESPEKNEDSDKSPDRTTQTRQSRNIAGSRVVNDRTEEKLKKSFDQRRVKIQKAASDSSSGREFCKGKLTVRNSYVSLKRISELDQDYTRSPDESPEIPKDVISKDHTFALKNSVNNFFVELKKVAKKLVNDVEIAQTKCTAKNSMRPMDVDRLILETKNVVTTLRECVDSGENKLNDYYGKWCKRARVKNVLRNKRPSNEGKRGSSRESPKRLSNRNKESGNESGNSTREVSPSRRNDVAASPVEPAITNGAKRSIVSDCSEEIFSGDETVNTTRKSAPASPSRSNRDESPEISRDKTSERKNISSDETEDVDVPVVKEKPAEPSNRCSSPLESSNRSIAKPQSEKSPRKPQRESISSKKLETSRDSVDPSDADMFEASAVESPDDEDLDKGESENEEKSSTKKTSERKDKEKRNSNDEESTGEPESPRKSCSPCAVDSRTTAKKSDVEVSGSEENLKKNPPTSTADRSSEISSETESNLEAPIVDDDDEKSNNPKVSIEENSMEKLGGRDESVKNYDAASSPAEQPSNSSEKKCQPEKNDAEDIFSAKNSLHTETSGDERELNEDNIPTQCYVKDRPEVQESPRETEKKDDAEAESIFSLDTVVGNDEREDKIKDGSTSPGINDPVNGSKSPVLSDIDYLTESPIVNDIEDGSRSSEINDSERHSSSDTVLGKDKDSDKSGSKSDQDKVSEKRSSLDAESVEDNDKNVEKSGSKSPEVADSGRRSSMDTVLADDLESPTDKSTSKSQSNVSRASTSSNVSETDNIRVRDMLLMSSNSDDSSAEDSSALPNSGAIDNEDTPPTPPESDSNGRKSPVKNSTAPEHDNPDKVKTRRNKFRIQDNPDLMRDKKLQQRCEIHVKRLKKQILNRHTRALKKSRDYVDSKKLKRLVALDKLDKKKKVATNLGSEKDDDTVSSSKDLKGKKKTSAAKEREETLLDHLERVENGENIELSNESDVETSDKEKTSKKKQDKQDEDSLFAEADRMAKKRLLESSDSAEEGPSSSELQAKDDKEEEKTKKTKKVVKKEKIDKSSEDEEKKQDKADKGRWRKNKMLTLQISDSDSEEEAKKFKLSQEKSAEKNKKSGSQSDTDDEKSRKKRVRRRVLHSDSDVQVSPVSDSESSDDSIKKKKNKKKGENEDDGKKKTRKRLRRCNRSSSSSDSLDEKRTKNRRKRIKTADSDSDSDLDNSQGTPGKSGRKNIRKVIRDKQVADDTKQAAKDEEARLQRIAERQKLYNQMYETRLAGEEKVEKLVLDFDEETKEPLVSVDEDLVKRLKPHQAQGIKFMWDACFESLERTKTTKGSGCILAHCMGLGKTFQIVSLSHTLLQHKDTGIKTIMVVCPLSTVLNWVNEFKIWLDNLEDGDDIDVYELTKMKKNYERRGMLQRWQQTGGVMIIGYEMFRNLSNTGKKVRKNIQEAFLKCLVDPGPDLIVCDEGHLLKNEDTALSKAMRRVKTLRRIVLTGTPLQNNLIEYHCMVQFVKPNLLGTKKEFTNRFENPITNGQFDDSTEYDVRLMKKRAHVLHKMLEGSVQRLDYSVLTPFLPPKQEYVIFVKLTDVQIKMYRHYLDNYARRHRGVGGSLFADFQALQRIWTHPLVMQMNVAKVSLANEKKRLDATDSEGSLRDFIDDGSGSGSTSDSSDVRSVNDSDDNASGNKPKRGTRANPVPDEPLPTVVDKIDEPTTNNDDLEWWTQFVKEDDYEDMRISSKLLLLFRILKESESVGDKVLVFSQSLYSLTLIERFLELIDDATQRGEAPENLDKHSGSWSLGLDYFRLDGQSSADNRRRWCDIFNKPSNTRARLFLISTRAGGLGINLTAANRVIIFDASWNPSHDVQSIFRIYRFGQKKPCYVYRLLAAGTMEEKIYNRQVTKLSLSCRVVDEQQIERHYSNNALAELYKLEISETETTLNLPTDRLLAEIFLEYKHCVENYHEHDSLLENQAGEELDDEERQQAWLEYEEEKKGKRQLPPNPFMNYQNELMMQQLNMMNLAQQNTAIGNSAMMLDYENLKQMMSKDYPGFSEEQQKAMASRTVYEMYNYVERQAMANQNPMPMMNLAAGLGFDNRMVQSATSSHPTPEMIRLYQQSLALQQKGEINYPMNQGVMGSPMVQARNGPVPRMPQLPLQSSASSSVVDDDIVEIPSSPEKSLVPPLPAPGGGGKSQEE